MTNFFITLNPNQPPQIILHPCENIPFKSREDAERYAEELKQKGDFFVAEYKVYEASTQ